MEVIKAGREPLKTVIECPHCSAVFKFDQRHIVIRVLSMKLLTMMVMVGCKHCTNPVIVTREKQAEIGVTDEMLFASWLVSACTLAERGKADWTLNGSNFTRVLPLPVTAAPVQAADPLQKAPSPLAADDE